jgi:hypothetical protein
MRSYHWVLTLPLFNVIELWCTLIYNLNCNNYNFTCTLIVLLHICAYLYILTSPLTVWRWLCHSADICVIAEQRSCWDLSLVPSLVDPRPALRHIPHVKNKSWLCKSSSSHSCSVQKEVMRASSPSSPAWILIHLSCGNCVTFHDKTWSGYQSIVQAC